MTFDHPDGTITFDNVDNYGGTGAEHSSRQFSFPGIDGVEEVRLGYRGETFNVTGWLLETSQSAIETFFNDLEAKSDGQTGTFTGRSGAISKDHCKLNGYNRNGMFAVTGNFPDSNATDGYFERYSVTFRKLQKD